MLNYEALTNSARIFPIYYFLRQTPINHNIGNCETIFCKKVIFNNYSPKEKLMLLNNPRDKIEGIIQKY